MFNHKLTTHLMPISESQGMLRELLETHRQTDGGGGGGGGGGGEGIRKKQKKRGACAYLSLSERGRAWVGVGAYSRLGTY